MSDEFRRTEPDILVYIPREFEGPDATNQHFNVIKMVTGRHVAFWTTATFENAPDQRVVCSFSDDDCQTWSGTTQIDGPDQGDLPGHGLASWEFPIVAPGVGSDGADRIYCFYNKNVGIDDTREDTTGVLRCRISDDYGTSWSHDTYDFPIAPNALSHPDSAVPPSWIVYQNPLYMSKGSVLAGFTRWASEAHDPGVGVLERESEVCFLEFTNILSVRDPRDIEVLTWPTSAHGIRIADPSREERSIAQEPSVQQLSDGRLICVMRSYQGAIFYSLSSDGGRAWTPARILRYSPDGPPLLNPISPCPLYKLADGRFLLLFYNNDGSANGGSGPADSKRNRYPAYFTVGRELSGNPDHPLHFGAPKEFATSEGVLIPGTPGTQVATYPSLVDDAHERIFFYPDRKHFLLGRRLPDSWLEGCDPKTEG